MSRLSDLRRKYLEEICTTILGYRKDSATLSIADRHEKQSMLISEALAMRMPIPVCSEAKEGQQAGNAYTLLTVAFLKEALNLLDSMHSLDLAFDTSQADVGIGVYDQYEHLARLRQAMEMDVELSTAIGEDYLVKPDITVSRRPVPDAAINAERDLVDDTVARLTPLRESNNRPPAICASISCKWTMRSDRAQNTRTEALNLIRNRKGSAPHIVAVTFEPLPSRIASIAIGTGDVDCTYHSALYELQAAVEAVANEPQKRTLRNLVAGRRLRDISDLPFDLLI